MKIKITIYKESGKYYTDEIVENKKDIFAWEEEFRDFVRNNIPAKLNQGYITVEDVNDNQSFHQILYKYEDLF